MYFLDFPRLLKSMPLFRRRIIIHLLLKNNEFLELFHSLRILNLCHSRPDQQQQSAEERVEKKPIIELPRIKTEIRQESFSHERRTLGDGIPQYQPYW